MDDKPGTSKENAEPPEDDPEDSDSSKTTESIEKTPSFEIPEDAEVPESPENISESPPVIPETPEDNEQPPNELETSEETSTASKESVDDPPKTADVSETPETSEEVSKPRKSSLSSGIKRKGSSIVQFLTGGSSKKKEEEEQRPKRTRRPSFVKRKLIALEKELTMENINQRFPDLFTPEFEKEDKDEEKADDTDEPKRKYLSSAMACMFLISATTGGAFSSLPFHLKESSWFGVFLNLLLGLNALYAGLCSCWCWTIMEEKWPEYLEYSRVPYQDIAYRAVGKWMKYIVAICVDLSILGSCATYLLFIADSLENIIFKSLKFCFTLIVISFLAMPIMMCSSYKNIKFIAVCDVLCSILFAVLMVISFFLEKPHFGTITYTDPSFEQVAVSFGGFTFAYGTGAVLPSIMVEMEDRTQFIHTCATAYMICIVLYTLFPIMGYAAYGDKTPRHIIEDIVTQGRFYVLGVIIEVVFVLQLLTTYVVAFYPTLHAFEVRLNGPDRFGFCRFLVRLIVMLLLLVAILGAPYLPRFMALVGASTMNLTTFIFPPFFYVCLIYRTKAESKREISKKEWILLTEIILLGLTAGVISTYVTIEAFQETSLDRTSCYLNFTSLPDNKNWLLE